MIDDDGWCVCGLIGWMVLLGVINSSGWEISLTLLGRGDFFHRLHTRGGEKESKNVLEVCQIMTTITKSVMLPSRTHLHQVYYS